MEADLPFPNAQDGRPRPPFHVGGHALLSTALSVLQAEAHLPETRSSEARPPGHSGWEPPGQTAPLLRGDYCKMKREGKEITEAPHPQRRKSRASDGARLAPSRRLQGNEEGNGSRASTVSKQWTFCRHRLSEHPSCVQVRQLRSGGAQSLASCISGASSKVRVGP